MSHSDPATRILVSTVDGARLAVRRYEAAGGQPVITLHGLATSGDIWDLPEVVTSSYHYRSLATALREAGLDLWLANLRGHGRSDFRSEPPPGQTDWSVDHFVLYDLPALVAHVNAVTGKRPFVLGASMGAMVLAGWLQGAVLREDSQGRRICADEDEARRRQRAISGAVFVELPASLRWPRSAYGPDGALDWRRLLADFWRTGGDANFPFELLARNAWLEAMIVAGGGVRLDLLRPGADAQRWVDRLPPGMADGLRRARAQVEQAALSVVSAFTGHRNYRAEVLGERQAVLDRVQAGVLSQMGKCVRERRFLSTLGHPDHVYSDHYHLIAAPALILAGGRDRIASAAVLREDFVERIASSDKTFVVLEDMAHGEIQASPAGSQRVYPLIQTWLLERAGKPG